MTCLRGRRALKLAIKTFANTCHYMTRAMDALLMVGVYVEFVVGVGCGVRPKPVVFLLGFVPMDPPPLNPLYISAKVLYTSTCLCSETCMD